MNILCLCQEDNHRKMLPGYARAFRDCGIAIHYVDWSPPFDTSLSMLMKRCHERPDCILHFDSDFPLLPTGLTESEIPTMHFDVDTYAFTQRRMRWASLFDLVSVCHPCYDEIFRRAGHPGAFLLAHAIRREFFALPELHREFEVGWVGQAGGTTYRRRQEWLPRLASNFRMNDWARSYSLQEVAEVYRRSRIVVNLGRDDFPQDANMRVFEALASGALLITALPSELTLLGFEEGQHFVGYRKEAEIIPLVKKYLKDEPVRVRIGQMGREKCIKDHTYDSRVEQFLDQFRKFGNQKLAPARRWPRARIGLMYLDFFTAHGVSRCAWKQFRSFAGHGVSETIQGAALLGKSWARENYRVSRSRPMRSADSMRRDWNERARKDAFFYIASWKENWNEETFFASGESDYQRLVEPVLSKLAVSPAASSMAELGCGAGRMTRAFARRFRSVTAIDISEVMQDRAKKYLAEFTNIQWVLCDGVALSGVESSSQEFVFSYLVLQHYPSAELVAKSIQEMMRILRPGGAFLFHFNGSNRPTMNWRGRSVSAVLDGLCSIGLKRAAKACARMTGIDPEMIGKTWRGVALRSHEVDKMVREAGGLPAGFQGVDTPFAWCFGRKGS